MKHKRVIAEWEKKLRKKIKKEFKRAVRIKGNNGYFTIIGESITGKEYKVKKIGTGEEFYIPKEYITKV